MKKLLITMFFFQCQLNNTRAQSLNLSDILNKVYSNEFSLSLIKGEEIDYIIPQSIAFLDTSIKDKNKLNYNFLYFKNQKSFENHLKQVHNVSTLFITYNKVYDGIFELTLEVSKTTDAQYFGANRFYIFVDKRMIKIVYNKETQRWDYGTLIKIWDEPHTGGD